MCTVGKEEEIGNAAEAANAWPQNVSQMGKMLQRLRDSDRGEPKESKDHNLAPPSKDANRIRVVPLMGGAGRSGW